MKKVVGAVAKTLARVLEVRDDFHKVSIGEYQDSKSN